MKNPFSQMCPLHYLLIWLGHINYLNKQTELWLIMGFMGPIGFWRDGFWRKVAAPSQFSKFSGKLFRSLKTAFRRNKFLFGHPKTWVITFFDRNPKVSEPKKIQNLFKSGKKRNSFREKASGWSNKLSGTNITKKTSKSKTLVLNLFSW